MMHRLGALFSGGGAALVIVVGCGGAPFELATGGEDATASADATADRPDLDSAAPEDAASERALDERALDAGLPDGRDASADRDASGDAATEAGAMDAGPAHCGGSFVCAPVVPSGWVGPFALYAGPNPSPVCGANFISAGLDGHAGLTAPPDTCACGCGSATGVQCSSPALTFYASMATCTLGTTCAGVTLTEGACTRLDMSTSCLLGVFMSLPGSTPSLGSCPGLGTTTAAPLAWTTNARACAVSQPTSPADCAAGSPCVPAPGAPYRAGLCIEQSGDVSCPAAGYTTKSLYYGGVDDTRGCSGCTCGSVTGASCSGSVTQFMSADAGCSTAQITYPLGQTCDPLQQPADVRLTLTPAGGSCAPNPVTPTGSATPSKAMTFCCAP
jgi:hypothetical protein